jgi:hypothetical protein
MATSPSFEDLEKLRRFLQEIRNSQIDSLRTYFHEEYAGFQHKFDQAKLSKASTATCVLSLVATCCWEKGPWFASGEALLQEMMLKPFDSAELGVDNPFTTAFALETYCALRSFYQFPNSMNAQLQKRAVHAENKLIEALSGKERGAVALKGYPPSAYLTQLVIRVLAKRGKLIRRIRRNAHRWALSELNRQIGLWWAKDKTADVFALAYAAMIVASLPTEPYPTPDEKQALRSAITLLFETQREDGTWPSSRPLFHYNRFGNAYCFDYEMLVQLIETVPLQSLLLDHLKGFNRVAFALGASEFPLNQTGKGWASGHHPQLTGPESWSTASVFHFAHVLDRLLAEAVRQMLFQHVNQTYRPPSAPKARKSQFAPQLIDSRISFEGRRSSLRLALWNYFVRPLIDKVGKVEAGGRLEKGSVSAIFSDPRELQRPNLLNL